MGDKFNAEDRKRTQCACGDVLVYLQAHPIVTAGELRAIFGHAAMRRVNDLKLGKGPDEIAHPIEVRRLTGAIFEVRYDCPSLGRPAESEQSGQRALPGFGGSFRH